MGSGYTHAVNIQELQEAFSRGSVAMFQIVLARIIRDVEDQVHLGWEPWVEQLRVC